MPHDRLSTVAAPRARTPGPDAGLIEACRQGDRRAFRDLFETCRDGVYSIALSYCDEEAAAHDITQDVFLKLFTAIRGFRGESDFRTWLFRLVVNSCLDERRRRRRLVPIESAGVKTEVESRAGSGFGTPESVVGRQALGRKVRTAVARLSPRLRLPVLLRYVEGLSYEEIAATLGCSMGTVASRLNRAHRALARGLAHLRDSV